MYVAHAEKLILHYWKKEIKNTPEVEELIIDLRESEDEDEIEEMNSL